MATGSGIRPARRGKLAVPVLRLGVIPGHLEQALQIAQHRPFDLRVHVVPVPAAPGDRSVIVAQVHPAGEADAPVHDEDLAVVADLPSPVPPPGPHRMEDRRAARRSARMRWTSSPENPNEPAPSITQTDAHAFLRLDADRVDEAAAVRVARPDVRLEQDLGARRGDGVEHRRDHASRTPKSQRDPVSGHHALRRAAEAFQFRLRAARRGRSQAAGILLPRGERTVTA